MLFKIAIILFVTSFELAGQTPESSIYLISIENKTDSLWTVERIEYLNSFNHKGYNNQVYFMSPYVLLASIRKPDENQNDIYKLDLRTRKYINLSYSLSSEYSPRLCVNDSKSIYCVRVSHRDILSQELVKLDALTGEYISTILPGLKNIAYYRQLDDDNWICYLLDTTHVLAICDARLKKNKIFASSIGRTFEVLNKDEVLYIQKSATENWLLKKYSISTEKSDIIAVMPKYVEDFTIDQDGSIYCASDSRIFRLSNSGRWVTVMDLKPLGITNLNRIAISKKLVAAVSVKKT